MISNSQKEHLTYTAIGQIAVLVGLTSLMFYYIIPGYAKLSLNLEKTNNTIKEYLDMESNGIGYIPLGAYINTKPEYSELIKIIQTDPTSTQEVITKKVGAGSYLSWLKDMIGGEASIKDKRALIVQKALLNSVIPTMSPTANSNIEESNITLKQYIKFIEGSVLKRFNFKSNTALGMQGITFGSKGSNVPENIGMFDFTIDFESTNSDILNFIEFVNNAGNPSILSYSGSEAPQIMSDPLITFSNFSIQNIINKEDPSGENSGRATITFYVRGITKDDIIMLKEGLKIRNDELSKKIDESVKGCSANKVLCASYTKRLEVFQKKYQEFNRSSAKLSAAGGGDEIYSLTQYSNTIKALESEFNTIKK